MVPVTWVEAKKYRAVIRVQPSEMINRGFRKYSSPTRVSKVAINSFLNEGKEVSLINPGEPRSLESQVQNITGI